MKTVKIDDRTALVDTTFPFDQEAVADAAKSMLGVVTEEVEREDGKHDGFFLRGNLMRYYHVQSVRPGIIVACYDQNLTPDKTREIARNYLGDKSESDT